MCFTGRCAVLSGPPGLAFLAGTAVGDPGWLVWGPGESNRDEVIMEPCQVGPNEDTGP